MTTENIKAGTSLRAKKQSKLSFGDLLGQQDKIGTRPKVFGTLWDNLDPIFTWILAWLELMCTEKIKAGTLLRGKSSANPRLLASWDSETKVGTCSEVFWTLLDDLDPVWTPVSVYEMGKNRFALLFGSYPKDEYLESFSTFPPFVTFFHMLPHVPISFISFLFMGRWANEPLGNLAIGPLGCWAVGPRKKMLIKRSENYPL